MKFFNSLLNNLKHTTKLEIVYIVMSFIGIVMIILSSLFCIEQESIAFKILNIIGDIGVCIFPTGIIGCILEKIQIQNKELEKRDKRLAVLRLVINSMHGYLNVICNTAIKDRISLKYKKVFEIIKSMNNKWTNIEFNQEEVATLKTLIEQLQNSLLLTDTLYIVTNIFDPVELNQFEILLKKAMELLNSMNQHENIQEKKNNFLSFIMITCSAIPECNNFNEMVSDGDNIYIGRK